MDEAVSALKAHFSPQRNGVSECHTFRKVIQQSHESVFQYVAALRDLAATVSLVQTSMKCCNFRRAGEIISRSWPGNASIFPQ